MSRVRALWIEDGVEFECSELAAPVYLSRRYDLDIALTITDAIAKIQAAEYGALVFDIRMDPEPPPNWLEQYQQSRGDKTPPRLGLLLLYSLLKPADDRSVPIDPIPQWLSSARIGVLSVETPGEMQEHLTALRISHHCQKKVPMSPTALLDLLDEITGIPSGSAA
jgi:hypothetical protein